MTSEILLPLILSSALSVAVVTSIKEIVLWYLNRKAKVSDDQRQDEDDHREFEQTLKRQQSEIKALSENINSLQKTMSEFLSSERILLRDKIKYLIFKYIEYGEITIDEKQAIQHMWKIYHYDFHGNGDLDDVMPLLEDIPLKVPVGVVTKNH